MMMDSNKKSGQRRQRGHLPKGRWIRVRQGWRQQGYPGRKPAKTVGIRSSCFIVEKRCAWAHGMLEKVRNEQTREELGAEETVVQKIKKRRLQWFGHVERME